MLWREELQVRGVTIMCGGWEVIYGECYSLASWECPHCYDTPECLNYGLASRERGGKIMLLSLSRQSVQLLQYLCQQLTPILPVLPILTLQS